MTSWSGGKDCALAMDRAIRLGGKPSLLLTTMIESGNRSRGHGLHTDVLRTQANAMGVPMAQLSTSWKDYTPNYLEKLKEIRQATGIEHGVFGDIDLQPHRDWVERACRESGFTPHLPLWDEPRDELVREVFDRGIRSVIIAVQDTKLPTHLLGKELDETTIEWIVAEGADACGENGEYHTVVIDAPAYREPIELIPGVRVLRDGYWFMDVSVRQFKKPLS